MMFVHWVGLQGVKLPWRKSSSSRREENQGDPITPIAPMAPTAPIAPVTDFLSGAQTI